MAFSVDLTQDDERTLKAIMKSVNKNTKVAAIRFLINNYEKTNQCLSRLSQLEAVLAELNESAAFKTLTSNVVRMHEVANVSNTKFI